MSYDIHTLVAGLAAMAERAESRCENVVLPPSKVKQLVELITPHLPDTTRLFETRIGLRWNAPNAIRLGVLKDLTLGNRAGAIHRLRRHFQTIDTTYSLISDVTIEEFIDAIEADAQEGTQNAS